jgi:hypothetical protein
MADSAEARRFAIQFSPWLLPLFWISGLGRSFGIWVVSGAATGTVWFDVDPPTRARAVGFPILLRRLGLGLEYPESLLEALTLAQPA